MSSEVETSLNVLLRGIGQTVRQSRDSSTSLGMTKKLLHPLGRFDAPPNAVNFSEKFLKLSVSDLERTGKDTTPSRQNQSPYEQQIPSWRSLIHHCIHRAPQLSPDSNWQRHSRENSGLDRTDHSGEFSHYP